MTVAEMIVLLKLFPRDANIKFSDDDGNVLHVDLTRESDHDRDWNEVVVHVTEVEQ